MQHAGFHKVSGATIQVTEHEPGKWIWRRGRVGFPPTATGGPFDTAKAAHTDAMADHAAHVEARLAWIRGDAA